MVCSEFSVVAGKQRQTHRALRDGAVGIIGLEVDGVLTELVREAYLEGPRVHVHNEFQIFPNLPPIPWFGETIAVGGAVSRLLPTTTITSTLEATRWGVTVACAHSAEYGVPYYLRFGLFDRSLGGLEFLKIIILVEVALALELDILVAIMRQFCWVVMD